VLAARQSRHVCSLKAPRRALADRHSACPRRCCACSLCSPRARRASPCLSARSRVGRSLESPRSLAGVAECVCRRCCRSAALARRLAPCSSVSPLQALALLAVRANAAGPLDGRRWPCVRWPSLG
jgi:hypothetical protein